MAYEFKRLSDVNVIEEMKDGLNVLVEDGGEIVKLAADSIISDAIPVPATAQVGQTIVVKSVDENGKPTEWEAADMASGAGDGTLFVKMDTDANTYDCDFSEIDAAVAAGMPVVLYSETPSGIRSFFQMANHVPASGAVFQTFSMLAIPGTDPKVYYEVRALAPTGEVTSNSYTASVTKSE